MDKPVKIVFLVLPRVHLLDLAGPLQVFQEAAEMGVRIELEYCSLPDQLVSSSEFPLGSIKGFESVTMRRGDYLIIPGAEVDYLISRKVQGNLPLLKWVRDLHDRGIKVCSICSGAFMLAATGLLDGRKCTTHWKRTTELQQRFPRIHVVEDVLFTESEGVYTSAGVTAGIDLALHLLGEMADDLISFRVARELVVYLRRSGSDSQVSAFMKYRNHVHSGVHRVQDYLFENIKRKVTLPQLADRACMSLRNLTRAFKKETGITVNEYTTLLRREMLKELVKDPGVSRRQMAKLCGLKSERQVIRLLKQK